VHARDAEHEAGGASRGDSAAARAVAARVDSVLAPGVAEYLPTAQLLERAAPAPEYLPAPQLVQAAELVCAVKPDNSPPAQLLQTARHRGATAGFKMGFQMGFQILLVRWRAWFSWSWQVDGIARTHAHTVRTRRASQRASGAQAERAPSGGEAMPASWGRSRRPVRTKAGTRDGPR
jgi:hypothetical protein